MLVKVVPARSRYENEVSAWDDHVLIRVVPRAFVPVSGDEGLFVLK